MRAIKLKPNLWPWPSPAAKPRLAPAMLPCLPSFSTQKIMSLTPHAAFRIRRRTSFSSHALYGLNIIARDALRLLAREGKGEASVISSEAVLKKYRG